MTLSPTLTEPRYAALRRALEAARTHLLAIVAAEADHARDADEEAVPAAEPLAEHEREMDSLLSTLQRTSLRDVEAALDRFDDGTFGRCTTCGEEIPYERLEVMPAAANCVRCQGAAEHRP